MPLGIEVSLGPGDTVLDGDQLPSKSAQPYSVLHTNQTKQPYNVMFWYDLFKKQ